MFFILKDNHLLLQIKELVVNGYEQLWAW